MPSGIWQADIESTGDASGGTNNVDVVFSNSGEEDDSFYSLEQFGDQHDAADSLARQLQVANQHNYRSPTTPITSVYLASASTGIAAVTGWAARDFPFLPLFLGTSPPAVAAVQLFIRWSIVNTTTVAYRVHAWGYRWGPRVFDTPTGPRRPLGGIFHT